MVITMITNALVATDGSESALRGARYAAYLATNLSCKVTLLHVVEFPPIPYYFGGVTEEERGRFENEVRESGRSILRLTQKPLADAGISVNLELREGRPADVICACAVEGQFDLIIVGNRGRGMVGRVLMGSVSNEVVQAATCPVLVVR
jgi:nucleotide-binding universal stress UspA family protein